MGLGGLKPRVLSTFVRNRLIDEVYLPLIGDNLAKQMGSVGESGRSDRQGLLLLISPPGYGKTTLMEYVANRLGLTFMKINGPAIGLGCDLACLADMRIASTSAKFGVTFLKLGLVPGDGGTWLLPRVIGEARAAELFFTGDVIDAATMQDWGLVSRVVEPDALMDEALALAEKVAAMPPAALRQTKMMLRQGRGLSYDGALELAASTQGLMHHTADHAEGVAALIEKRAPDFRGE